VADQIHAILLGVHACGEVVAIPLIIAVIKAANKGKWSLCILEIALSLQTTNEIVDFSLVLALPGQDLYLEL
jgi:hypothetical protein